MEIVIPEGWTETTIGSVIERVQKKLNVDKTQIYREIGIRSHGKGIFYKEPIMGFDLGEKNVFWIVPNCLILNIVFAWEQAIAMTSNKQDGMIASHRFPMYQGKLGKSDPRYFFYIFMTKYGKYLLNLASPGGAGRNKTLGQENFFNTIVTIPPLGEQVKIAEILTAWDESLETLEKLIAAKLELKRGLMQELLTGKTRFKEFEAREHWKIKTLESLTSLITKGTTPSSFGFEFINEGINFVKVESVNQDGKFIPEKFAKISSEANQALKRSILQKNDILFSIAGALGRTAIVNEDILPANTNQAFAIVRLENEYTIQIAYLFQYLRSEIIEKKIGEISVTAAQPNVSLGQLNQFEISIPPLEEQKRIANVLTTLDSELENLKTQLGLVKTQKKGLMQKLLTGQIRVQV